jgi:predicted amidohydrolase YtcJ
MTMTVMRPWKALAALMVFSSLMSSVRAQQPAPDLILTNGKIITVDDRFTVAQAVAVKADRVIAVGTSRDIGRLAGPGTRTIDLKAKAAIPGLIDNHLHLMRAGTTWQWEVRWDGVSSRRQALEMLRARAKAAAPGEWVFNLGGWTVDQFADDKRPFTREELDRIVSDHPVLLQSSYYRVYLNSRGLQAVGIDDKNPDSPWVERDAAGRPTGVIGEAGVRPISAKLPVATPEQIEASSRLMISDLNKMGLTSVGSVGCEDNLLPAYRKWEGQGQLNLRVFCIVSPPGGGPQQADQLPARISAMKLFQGDSFIDQVFYGEGVYGPLQDPMFVKGSSPRPEQLAQFKRIATEIAKAGLPLHQHVNLTNTIDAFLDQIEEINKEHPIKNLRWTFAHINQINASQLDRMKKLGMYAALHPWSIINGGIYQGLLGEQSYDFGPVATIQSSGVMWGFGSDGTRANQIMPFTTLWWAVTGKMVGGTKVLRDTQTISREDALIAHTRRNAFFVFQEDNLGSIQPGKLADILVLDRDYLTVPADQIKDIKPVMTIVGGRVVYDEAASTTVRRVRAD